MLCDQAMPRSAGFAGSTTSFTESDKTPTLIPAPVTFWLARNGGALMTASPSDSTDPVRVIGR